MSMKMKFGSKDIPFVYKGDKLIYPNPIKDGLLLWYDFKGMRNTDTNKEVAKDLSGNGNDGTLTNFNFTEGSGYKDNTLVFDGVDDKLTIPELELDETAMSVVHDGKLYAYEDDKVLTIGEDGEIVGSGKNLVYNTSFTSTEGWRTITSKILGVNNNEINLEVIEGIAWNALMSTEENSVYIEEGVPYTITYEINLENPLIASNVLLGFSNYGIPDKAGYVVSNNITNQLDKNKLNEWQTITTTIIPEKSEESTLYIRFGIPEKNTFLKVRNIMVEKGTKRNRKTLSPKDFITTEYSPPHMKNLQLYNKTLRKDELLYNAESKGLKKLKPGVVVQDGLMLHYDFSHESNNSEYKGKAFDYSGNGNHGTLQNFNFTEESGYVEGGLKFDGVDDAIVDINMRSDNASETYTFVVRVNESKRNNFLYAGEELKIDLYYNRIARADVNPSLSIRHDAGYETFYGVLVKDGLEHTTYINGVVVDKAILNSTKPSRIMNIGNYIPQGKPNIDLFNLKVYNRPLTPEEVAHNYTIEKERFNIEGDV